ncbi:MAG: TIGR02584 family CRISPR-associated protein [Marinospirillum sp.]|uniref:CRISPR-associated ring nuclease Csm6 n=1 Tax=Marinospirillum sp. TaxID=2183934 RepID=UPI001A03C4D4|nr:CRISPR-associated ring nuclease Csm6 [Marinospirillum sp.]MBE0509012.1 TIGR02584 family CRISPR-associated protein [Marinospirillum sp.]
MRKRAFLMVSGLSPQIVTETLYAHYITYGMGQSIPSDVYLITTLEGASRAKLSLLHGNSWFHKLLDEYGITNLRFQEENILVIKDQQTQASLNDIRTEQDNAIAADFITATIGELTKDDTLDLHVSLAGGRKTMGYYVGYALSLYGRPGDSLSHVLVSEGFENNPQFFFPSRATRVIYDRDEKPLDCSKAEVTLARISFVLMRDELPEDALVKHLSFSEAVDKINQQLTPPKLVIDLANRCIRCNDVAMDHFTRSEYQFYVWWIARHLQAAEPLHPLVEGDLQKDWGEDFLQLMKQLGEYADLQERSIDAYTLGMDNNHVSSKRSSIAKKIRAKLGKRLSQSFTLNTQKHPSQGSFYTFALSEDQIEVLGGNLF